MNLSEKYNQYIKDNIDLIDLNKWQEFFENAPHGIGEILLNAGIDFLSEVSNINTRMFTGSDIKIFEIPSNIVIIGDFAFEDCSQLEEIHIPDNVHTLGTGAFSYCGNLVTVIVGKGIRKISQGTFRQCRYLYDITLPNTITQIEEDAFSNCYNLHEIIFQGTKKEWEAIQKDVDWDQYTGEYEIKCSDGNIVKKKK